MYRITQVLWCMQGNIIIIKGPDKYAYQHKLEVDH